MQRGAWRARVHGVAESDMTSQLSTHTQASIQSIPQSSRGVIPGGGNIQAKTWKLRRGEMKRREMGNRFRQRQRMIRVLVYYVMELIVQGN